LTHPWKIYDQYRYIRPTHINLHKLPLHLWCSTQKQASEYLLRAARLVEFVNQTGLIPIQDIAPITHKNIKLTTTTDHITWWLGANGELVVIIEPYKSIESLQSEIANLGLCAIVLPKGIGIYGGDTNSVVLTEPKYAKILSEISSQLPSFNTNHFEELTEALTFSEALHIAKHLGGVK